MTGAPSTHRNPAIKTNRSLARGAVFGAALILAAGWTPIVKGDDPTRPESLDVFVLVDVSRSMYLTRTQSNQVPGIFDPDLNGPAGGSDPQRQRWDAVRLLLDLLTADDRVTILPFNEVAPARYQYVDQFGRPFVDQRGQLLPPFEVPGPVADVLRSPRSDQDRLARTVEVFANDRDNPHRDLGGTGIFYALKLAHARASAEPFGVGRKPVILLLTDGDDTELIKEDGGEKRRRVDRDDSALMAQIRGDSSPRTPIPVYTLGLGAEVKDDLLVRIARLTGGSYRKIGPATALVPTFRDLIWSLKYCWIKKEPAGSRRSQEGLEGILDLGILSYRDQIGPGSNVQGPFARDARKPSPTPAVAEADLGRFSGQRRQGNQGRDYLYEAFGPLNLKAGSIVADWGGDPAADPLSVSFSKRTARPLFKLSEPADEAAIDRHERLRIVASFNPVEPFRREHFRLHYSLRPAGEEPNPDRLIAMDPSFEAEVDLPLSTRDRSARYTLRVEGLGDPDRLPLAGYRLVLPEKTIEVRDVLRLVAEPPTLRLSTEAREATVRIRGVRPLGDNLKLSYRVEPPVKRGEAAISAQAIVARPSLGSAEAREVVFQGGSASIDLALASGANQPRLGAEYDPGTLVVSAGADLGVARTEIRIPIQLQLRPASLAIAATGPIRAVAGAANPVPPARLRVVEEGRPKLAAGLMAAVTLKRARGAEFPAEELWIEPAVEPAPVGRRSRTLGLPLGREFVVRFQPSGNFGQHEYDLDVRLAGKDEGQANSARASVSVEYEYPSLAVATPTVEVRIPRGGSRKATIRATLQAPAGLRRPVTFRPDATGRDNPFIAVEAPAGVTLDGQAEATLDLDVKVAADTPLGSHPIRGMVFDRDGKAREAQLTVLVVVDELRVGDRTANLDDVHKPIPVELWMGSNQVRRLDLTTALAAELPGPIRIAGGGAGERPGIAAEVDPRDDGGAFLLPRRAILKPADGDEKGRSLAIEFPAVANVEPNRPYRVYLDLAPDPASGLAPRLLEFEVRYRRTDDLQAASP